MLLYSEFTGIRATGLGILEVANRHFVSQNVENMEATCINGITDDNIDALINTEEIDVAEGSYSCVESIYGLSYSFAVIFLIVAIIVCYTAIAKMISEQRTLICAQKALGFTSKEILKHYMLFNSISSQFAMMGIENSQNFVSFASRMILMVSVFICMIIGALIVYANCFFLKRRKKEIGIYITLGMEQKDIFYYCICVCTLFQCKRNKENECD